MMEALKEQYAPAGWRGHVKNIAGKLGFPVDERGFAVPDLIGGITKTREGLLKKVESTEHISVEDYDVVAKFGLVVKDNASGKLYGPENTDFNQFRRLLRVERIHDTKEAPSVWRGKPLLLSDVDFMLRGNPHAPVKNFAGC